MDEKGSSMSHNRENKKWFILPLFIALSMIGLSFLLSATASWFCDISYEIKYLYNHIEYQNIQSTMISVSFTTLGFAITLRNILIGRDRDKYYGFSLKSIINYSTKAYSKICWYIIMLVPFMDIYLYFRGFKRQVIFFTLLSAMSMIIYFLTVLQRIRKDVHNETIAYIFIDNILNPHVVYFMEYKEELFQKLFCNSDTFPEVNLVFDYVLEYLYKIVCDQYFLKYSHYKYIKMTSIQQNIRRRLKKTPLDSDTVKKALQTVSFYSYDYFNRLFQSKRAQSIKPITEQIMQFIKHSHINVSILAMSRMYKDCMNQKTEIKKKNRLNDNAYLLFFNYLLGIMCAGINNLSFDEYRILTDKIAEICTEETVLLTRGEIDALSVLVLYYQEINGGFDARSNGSPSYFDIIAYCRSMVKNTDDYDYILLERFLFEDFSIYNSQIKFGDALMACRNEFIEGNGVFLTVLDH